MPTTLAPVPTIGGQDKFGNSINIPYTAKPTIPKRTDIIPAPGTPGSAVTSASPNMTNNPSVTGDPTGRTLAPVASSLTATNLINNKVIPTMNNAQTQITTAQQLANEKAAADKLNVSKVTPTTPPVPLTPEQMIANQGMKTVYDNATGQPKQIPDTEPLPAGFSTIDKQNAVPIDTTVSSDGNITFKKLPDGSFGQYDTKTGQYMGQSNQTQFDLMKTGQSNAKAYQDAITNGPLLNDNQKAQIQSIQATYQRLLDQQAKDNANFTGGTTVAQNLYGMGNTMMGAGQIKGTVDAGVAKLADLTSKMNSDVAKMTQAFQSDNLAVLKDAYTSFQTNSQALQKEIDTQHAVATQLARDVQQQKETAENQIDNDIRAFQNEVAKVGGAENPEAYAKALANRDYSGMVEAAGNVTTAGIGGEYNMYKRDELARGTPPAQIMSFNQYGTADANRKAKVAAAGAAIAAGTDMTTKQQSVFNTIINQQQKSPLIMANDRAVILKNITDEVSKDPSNAALQVSFIYSMVQALDTYQSAVREGEISLIQSTQGLGEKLGNVASQVEKGNPLNPSKIAEYVKVSKTLTDSINNAANAKKNNYRAQAQVNGIGSQYQQWDDTVSNLNKKTITEEHKESNEKDPLGIGTMMKGTSKNNQLGI
jgi:predicted  nucleic acid-binding Zn-ribbon protein